MRKHRKAKQRQMNNPIMQLMWAIDAVNASMAKRFQQEPTK